MKQDKRKRLIRIVCLLLVGVIALSLLGSVLLMLLY